MCNQIGKVILQGDKYFRHIFGDTLNAKVRTNDDYDEAIGRLRVLQLACKKNGDEKTLHGVPAEAKRPILGTPPTSKKPKGGGLARKPRKCEKNLCQICCI